ncbi:tyrosine-type recombinase/integrase [Promicromonospora iranensis]|uniref:Integrase n=1 Tax=Promicromonospora iranensis TaxID=1105144 RepID=A0ABU2CIX1_9MICO|nr:tyrosine-type recombinase/integrase [Promicromonospora iranensis]MDR7381271.1 integrase [Promicromonospora iranensis]
MISAVAGWLVAAGGSEACGLQLARVRFRVEGSGIHLARGWQRLALCERLELITEEPPEHLLFLSRNHTPLTSANVRRRLRTILAEVGITGLAPHSFRRTVATAIERGQEGNADLAAATLGHTSSAITKRYYIEKNNKVDPMTATILEGLAPTD